MFEQPFMMSWPSINRGGLWDYEADFTVDNWTDADSTSGVNTGNNRFEFNYGNSAGVKYSYVDALGAAISDTAFVFRWREQWSAIGVGGANSISWLGISDQSAAGRTTSQDCLCAYMGDEISPELGFPDGAAHMVAGAGAGNTAPSTSTNYYNQIIRNSATSATFTSDTSSYGGTGFANDTETIGSTIDGLRYITWNNRNDGGGQTGYIDEIFLADGVTSPP